MINTPTELNLIFSVAEEIKPNNGEDSYYFGTNDSGFVIASLDGLGGAGSKKYTNYNQKSGAYIASRAIAGAVKAWFDDTAGEGELSQYMSDTLAVCNKFADKTGLMKGSLSKAFPTTAAVTFAKLKSKDVDATCLWAGDSRCYMLDAKGLHQLSNDDLDDEDAMSNLKNDAAMTNVINASTEYVIHKKEFSFTFPCVLLTATDGCFGYLNSPMEFEYLLTDSLEKSANIMEWKKLLNERMYSVTGDDYTLCVAACGFKDFDSVKKYFADRNRLVYNEYIASDKDVNMLWNTYKDEYSKYL